MIRVLVVDDSPSVRRLFERKLSREPGIEVVGSAPDAYAARAMVAELRPDVLTLDIEMPRMDGITFLRELMRRYPLPVVVVSSLAAAGGSLAVQAMEAGAVEVLCKERGVLPGGGASGELIAALRRAASADVSRAGASPPAEWNPALLAPQRASAQVVAIGASTGGTTAISQLLAALPAAFPGTLITQHMPELFTASFAARLDATSRLSVREAHDGELVVPGTALVAPGNRHMRLRASNSGYRVELHDGPPVNGHRPSVDELFRSTADVVGRSAVGVLLSGMGRDGAEGLLQMRRAGARTVAQSEASCVVYGMPRVAAELGAADDIVDLQDIPRRVCELLTPGEVLIGVDGVTA